MKIIENSPFLSLLLCSVCARAHVAQLPVILRYL